MEDPLLLEIPAFIAKLEVNELNTAKKTWWPKARYEILVRWTQRFRKLAWRGTKHTSKPIHDQILAIL